MSTPLACVRCRTKKIRCDALAPSCSACKRANEDCLVADLLTNREYNRGYIQALEERLLYLENVLRYGRSGPLNTEPIVEESLEENDIVAAESVNFAAVDQTPAQNGEPSRLPEFLGDVRGIKLARLIVGAMKQTTSQFDIRRNLTSPSESGQRINDFTAYKPNPLPSRTLADQLLKSYLKGPHVVHPFLQVSELAQTCDRIYTSQHPPAMDLFIINMVFAIGAVSLVSNSPNHNLIMGYYSAAMAHFKDALQLKGLKAIQAILLVVRFRIYYYSPGPSVWDLSRLAIRICIEERLHLEPETPLSPMEHQMRRRIFWDCYALDRRSSQILGWPFAIEDEDIETMMPQDLDDIEIESDDAFLSCSRKEPSSLASFLHLIRLRQITSRVRQIQGRLVADSRQGLVELDELYRILQSWRASAPIFLRPRSIYQTAEWFDLCYHMEILALFRPFLGRSLPEITTRCLDCSLGVIFAYCNICASNLSIYTWTYVYGLYTAGLCCAFCIMVSSAGFFDTEKVKEGINRCRQTLNDIATKWSAISPHAESIDILGQEVIKALDERSDHFWKEVEEATISGLHESMGTQNAMWTGTQQDAVLPPDVLDCGPSWATGFFNELFSSNTLDLVGSNLEAQDI